jgi:hypothetical protein
MDSKKYEIRKIIFFIMKKFKMEKSNFYLMQNLRTCIALLNRKRIKQNLIIKRKGRNSKKIEKNKNT